MRILVDTNVLARAVAGPPSPAHEVFLAATAHEHVLVLSPFLADELDRVLRYPRLRPIHGLSDDKITQYVADLVLVAEIVDPPANAWAISSDPDDNPILAAALAGKVAAICTLDRHFHEPGVKAFCAVHRIEVLTDVELLARLRGGTK